VEPTNEAKTTVLGRGTVFEGKLKLGGEIRIDGSFSGEITNADTVIIAPSAKVSADIHAGRVVVDGEMDGKIQATQAVELHEPCRAKCTVDTPSLSIAPGAVFEGSCVMGSMAKKVS
jgi:cytoskeletal protein CcmA (bactofilin family)